MCVLSTAYYFTQLRWRRRRGAHFIYIIFHFAFNCLVLKCGRSSFVATKDGNSNVINYISSNSVHSKPHAALHNQQNIPKSLRTQCERERDGEGEANPEADVWVWVSERRWINTRNRWHRCHHSAFASSSIPFKPFEAHERVAAITERFIFYTQRHGKCEKEAQIIVFRLIFILCLLLLAIVVSGSTTCIAWAAYFVFSIHLFMLEVWEFAERTN